MTKGSVRGSHCKKAGPLLRRVIKDVEDANNNSSHRRCSIKKLFLKISQYSQETTVLESLLNKNAGLQQHRF